MAQKKKRKKTTGSKIFPETEYITPQYRYIKELSQLKYDAEEKREQGLLQQSNQMQTAFSFMTAAVFMAVPICIDHKGALELKFFLVHITIITAFLLASLVLASIAQWRWKTKSFPDVKDIMSSVRDNPEWEKFLHEYNQIDQWVDLISEVQAEKAKLNDRRVKLIMASMICFYSSIACIVFSFILAVIHMI